MKSISIINTVYKKCDICYVKKTISFEFKHRYHNHTPCDMSCTVCNLIEDVIELYELRCCEECVNIVVRNTEILTKEIPNSKENISTIYEMAVIKSILQVLQIKAKGGLSKLNAIKMSGVSREVFTDISERYNFGSIPELKKRKIYNYDDITRIAVNAKSLLYKRNESTSSQSPQ